MLRLGVTGFSYPDLFQAGRLRDLFQVWLSRLAQKDVALHARYEKYRAGEALSPEALSALLVDVTPQVTSFVVELFGIEKEWQAQANGVLEELVVFRFKDDFIKRRALKKENEPASREEGDALLRGLGLSDLNDERGVARAVCGLLDREIALKTRPVDDPELVKLRAELASLERWVIARKPELSKKWLAYRFPATTPDPFELVQLRRPSAELPEMIVGPESHRRLRDGFALTDRRMSPSEVLAEVDYCIYCHDRDKDSCAKGLHDKSGAIKVNGLGVPLAGCPLDEKISEMHTLKERGDAIGALALVCLDNPMLPGTGHRICNDCMKSCIYQKQAPVNIPQIETGVLTDVLSLPWGFEIYGLFTRWNPLNVKRPYPAAYRGKDVLVVGLGPAGYTLAHHLMNDGFGVVGVDGLKLEPLPKSLVGDVRKNEMPEPVKDFSKLYGELDDRILLGFGGVSEYGITVRWDKNFLTVLYATLLRRDKFRCYGGVRFGGTLTLDDAWKMGFAHVAIAVGAGKPTIIDLENNLIRGIRKASDFLMALQLTGAYKKTSPANLQVRLPAIVIGGGLTAIDTATELAAYYIVQCEKTLDRYDRLVKDFGPDKVENIFDGEEFEILEELLDHARQINEERAAAKSENRPPNFQKLIDHWGGVSLAYRKRLVDSPAYRLNHEEVEKCLEEGVRFIENVSPIAAIPDAHGALRAMTFKKGDQLIELPARTVCIAAGTSPNTIYEKEFPGTFKLDKKGFFAPHRARSENGRVVLEPTADGFFTSYEKDGHTVSYYGDNHPKYAGSVVKAMASAKHGFVEVAELFGAPDEPNADEASKRENRWNAISKTLDEELQATVVAVNRLTSTIVEVVVHAPLQSRQFKPGQFYRLQNYESSAPVLDGTRLTMEGLALTGAWTDPERGLLSLIVLEMGGSSRLVATLKKGEPVVVMGPTGTPTEIPHNETVLLAGGGLGNAVLFSIGKALRAAGCKVIYFAGYRKKEDLFKMDDIEAAADEIVWSVDGGEAIVPRRAQDRSFVGNVVQSMLAYTEGRLGENPVPLREVKRIIAIGSDRMMRAVKDARHGVLQPHLQPDHVAVASINSPMQCMMKEVCAQCLQKHVDPKTGKESIIFSCYNQDQEMDHVDFTNLAARLRANTVQEKLANLWFEKIFREQPKLRQI